MAQIIATNEIGILATTAVREFFANHSLTSQWRWSTDKEQRVVEILEQWPITPQNFPMITVKTSYVGEAEHYLGDSAGPLMLGGVETGQQFSGTDTYDVQYSVYAYGKPDVDMIVDSLVFGLKRDVETSIHENSLFNVRPQHGIRNTGEGGRPLTDDRIVYFVNISQQMKSTWYDEVVLSTTVLSYLMDAERENIDGSTTTTIQFKAS